MRLKDGSCTRHLVDSSQGTPHSVAMSPDETIWATLQSGNQLLRIEPGGVVAAMEVPRRGSVPKDVAVGPDNSVWFLQFRASRIGRWNDGRFSDYEVAKENVGLSGLAVAPDGAVWFGMLRQASLGQLRNGTIETFKLSRENACPYSVAIDPDGNVWYADFSGYVGMLPALRPRLV